MASSGCRFCPIFSFSLCSSCLTSLVADRLKREEQVRSEQEKWKRRMETESVDTQEQLSDLGVLVGELRGSMTQKEKEITTLQGR